ncbi:ribosomal protein l4/L1 family domain-containing protein [Ditylenchus destructor]|uniref:Large ribosomal subunit protein uL3c n=1 Tax=Ditylenchus destructor TaxID=166010 RepID=A0AAD4MEX6_9BILA|nr:ribosomal protein l4/L1 family domain-containing protein [Ditylenchus destructor]
MGAMRAEIYQPSSAAWETRQTLSPIEVAAAKEASILEKTNESEQLPRLLGRKVGMMRLFTDDGDAVPVTVVDVSNNRVTQIKSQETDGYVALQVTFGSRKASRVNKPEAGHLAKAGVEAGEIIQEFRVTADTAGQHKAGGVIPVASVFSVGQKVDVQGTSIGKGYAGTIKRHNMSSQRASHGNSRSHNVPGSIGMAQDPGRVFPGKRMRGPPRRRHPHHANLDVFRIDEARQLLLIKGAIPGAKGSPRSEVMELELLNEQGQAASKYDAPDTVFGREYNEALIHQVVVAYQANARQGTRAQKDREQVKHSTKKPFKQKGTGRARAGMTSSPLRSTRRCTRRHGVHLLAARPRRPSGRGRFDQGRLAQDEAAGSPFQGENLESVLVIAEEVDENLYLASRNLVNVLVVEPRYADPVSLVHYKKVLVTKGAVDKLKEMFA